MRSKIIVAALMLVMPTVTYAVTVTDYLIDSDMGEYSRSYPGACPKGSGVLSGAGHFKLDHIDYACDIRYYNEAIDNGVEVQVTQHSGSDSDKWLLHELDDAFRDQYGIPTPSYYPWQIDNKTILIDAVGGREYRWLSGNKVVMIRYRGSITKIPEPKEVVKAYLTKHPSTLTALTLSQLRSTENKTAWVKAEMDRRLWLCDKWFMQLQFKKAEEKDVYREAIKSMDVFLDYRQKYYSIAGESDKNLLADYLSQNNGTGIKAKLTEYKNWWTVNKEKSIAL